MIGIVTRVQVKSGESIAAEGRRLWLEELLPALKRCKGYRGATLLNPDQNNSAQSVVLWETAEDAETALKSGAVQNIAEKFGPLMMSEPVRSIHAITIDERA